jgi:thiamine pyrophosphokinase
MHNKTTPSRRREFFYLKTIIFANGMVEKPELLNKILNVGDFLIAADGGLRHIRALGLSPDLVIGDLDSMIEKDLKWLFENSIETRKFPKKKDQTDLELALLAAVDRCSDSIVVVGALGGRIDQTLTNIFLLLMPELQGVDVCLDDGHEELFLIQNHVEVVGRKGDTVSLVPLLTTAEGVKTVGLRYPLRNEFLFPERSRGVSNEMEADKAEISLKRGLLLCVHTRKLKGK